MENHIRALELIENEVAADIRANHARELAVVDAALNQIIIGFNEFSSLKGKPDNRLESAWVFLAIRSFNSLRTARQTLEHGYYQQAMTLVRMAMEDQMIVEDVENHTPTLDALWGGNGKIGRGDLALTKMAERTSPEAKEAWDYHYGFVSEYAAHPRERSLRGLISTGLDGQITLQVGSSYDVVEANTVLYYLLRQLVLVCKTVAVLTDQTGGDWADRSVPILDAVMSLWQQIDEWASAQLDEPNE